MPSAQDTAFRQLFAHPEILRDLLSAFAPADWIAQLDLATLERVNGSYVTGDGAQRHSDMVWKARLQEQWIYLYILLEFQSTPDHWMALRMHVYIGLMYQDLVKRGELPVPGALPPVLPVVLYSGKRAWQHGNCLSDLHIEAPRGMAHLQAQQRFLLLDLQSMLVSEEDMMRNLASLLLGLHQRPRRELLGRMVRSIVRWTKSAHSDELRRTVDQWLRLCLPAASPASKVPEGGNDMDMPSRLRFPTFENFWDQVHYGELLEGKQSIVEMLLIQRFGPLQQEYLDRMELGTAEDFDVWAARIVDAKIIEDVFFPDPAQQDGK